MIVDTYHVTHGTDQKAFKKIIPSLMQETFFMIIKINHYLLS